MQHKEHNKVTQNTPKTLVIFKFVLLFSSIIFMFLLLTNCGSFNTTLNEVQKGDNKTGFSRSINPAPPLLLISIDGFRYDYLEKASLPNFTRLYKNGLLADSLQHVFPTKTFVTHYSLVTGLYADETGVVANNMWDPQTESRFSLGNTNAVSNKHWYGGEPIWNTLEKTGKQAATYFWPGSEADIGNMRPTIWMPYDEDASHNQRVEQVLAWLDLPGAEKPEFLTLYFSNVDDAGHHFGPDSQELITALHEVDRTLGLLIDGIEARGLLNSMHILVTSDHGMQTINMERDIILLDNYLDLSKVRVSDWSPVAHIWETENGLSVNEIYTALHEAHPNMRVWKKADVPARYHYSAHKRVPDIVAEADVGWVMSSHSFYARRTKGAVNGMHGWDPSWHNMHGIFIAHGPAFAPGSRAPSVRSIDIYSLMAKLMHIEPAKNSGNPSAFSNVLYNVEASIVSQSNWMCDSALLVLRESEGFASLAYNGRVFSLPRQVSVSGLHYEDIDVMFRSLGNKTEVLIDGESLNNCRRVM